jgi:hypothetical protein
LTDNRNSSMVAFTLRRDRWNARRAVKKAAYAYMATTAPEMTCTSSTLSMISLKSSTQVPLALGEKTESMGMAIDTRPVC